MSSRAGHAFDPEVVKVFITSAPDILDPDPPESAWAHVLDAEPRPWRI